MRFLPYILLICLLYKCKFHYESLIEDIGQPIAKVLKKNNRYKYLIKANYNDSIFPPLGIDSINKSECLIISNFLKFNANKAKHIKLDTMRIKNLKELRCLSLSGLNFSYCYNAFNYLTSIEDLNLDLVLLDTIPHQISNLKKLKRVSLRLNNLKNLPNWFKKMDNIRVLDLANNSFKKFPKEVLDLDSLKVLMLCNPEGKEGVGKNELVIHANKIDYLSEVDLLIQLLSKKQIEIVYIGVMDYYEKKKIIEILKEKNLNKKIKIYAL